MVFFANPICLHFIHQFTLQQFSFVFSNFVAISYAAKLLSSQQEVERFVTVR